MKRTIEYTEKLATEKDIKSHKNSPFWTPGTVTYREQVYSFRSSGYGVCYASLNLDEAMALWKFIRDTHPYFAKEENDFV